MDLGWISAAWSAIGPLAGAALGAYIGLRGTRQTLAHETQQTRERRQLEKYEAIHEGLGALDRAVGSLAVQILGHVQLGRPFDPTYKGLNQPEIARLRMLIDFYAPLLDDDMKGIEAKVKELGERVVPDAVKAKGAGKAGGSVIVAAFALAKDVEKSVASARTDVAQIARDLTSIR